MTQVTHKRSPDEPEGGWLGPSGPGGWPDLEALDRKQRGLPEQPALHEFLLVTPADLDLFGKLLRMLASTHDGERASAAKKATEFLAARKLDWHAVVDLVRKGAVEEPGNLDFVWQDKPQPWQPPPRPATTETIDHVDAANLCLRFKCWTPREREFLENVRWYDRPSEKQLGWLADLYKRYVTAAQYTT